MVYLSSLKHDFFLEVWEWENVCDDVDVVGNVVEALFRCVLHFEVVFLIDERIKETQKVKNKKNSCFEYREYYSVGNILF